MAERIYISNPGEYFDDCFTIEANLNNRTKAAEISALACERLMQKESVREKQIQYLANKRGISFDRMRNLVLSGDYEPMSTEETKALAQIKAKAEE